MNEYIKQFDTINISDISIVGGKNASLGEMFSKLGSKGILIPNGFAITVAAFQKFLQDNQLNEPLKKILSQLDTTQYSNLSEVALSARTLLLNATLSSKLQAIIIEAYKHLGNGANIAVAVRSSATAEDLPNVSFAGQHESFLNISGEKELIQAVKKCYASLYTDRAIKYREDNHFKHENVLLSVGIQKMIRSDVACSGIAFTLDTESGFKDIVQVSGVWGLGENIVQGNVTPDEFIIFKPTLLLNKNAIIQKHLGEKNKTMMYDVNNTNAIINIDTPTNKKNQFVLNDDEITQIAKWAIIIENHYQLPMDIEWAKDGMNQQLYIVQARPETVHTTTNNYIINEYTLLEKGTIITSGNAVGTKIKVGNAKVLTSPKEIYKVNEGDIIVTDITSPDWDPALKKSGGIVTNKGGRTSHASIVARELGVPAIVGCTNATDTIKDGEIITVCCSEGKTGYVFKGKVSFKESQINVATIKKPATTEVMLIVSEPDKVFHLSKYPNDGVGLLRIEFIITHAIKIHPMALVNYHQLKNQELKKTIDEQTKNYENKENYFIEKLSEGIATIAAAFYPKDVIVRMSDFKTNEYANLIGGEIFEPKEENPMLGFRGASRYYNNLYKEGFRLECSAIKKVRNEMGFENVKVMIPFCRTVDEGKKVIDIMKNYGLEQGINNLEIYVMAEIPSNVILAEEFGNLFDGFSIGSNDLTQLVLGIDRDSTIINNLFTEQNEAVKWMIATMIKKAKKAGLKIGLCGQAPSDYPAFAQFLVEQGINSISFNADALLQGIDNINIAEKKLLVLA